MSIIQSIRSAIGIDESTEQLRVYECRECGNTFESAKDPDRATCLECLSDDLETRDRSAG